MSSASFPSFRPTSLSFDVAVTAVALTSCFVPWTPEKGTAASKILTGVRSFALANLADRYFRRLLPPVGKKEPSLVIAIGSAVAEGVLYSVVLRTNTLKWAIPRFVASLVLGKIAAYTFYPPVNTTEKPTGFTKDTFVGFAWAVAREGLTLVPGRFCSYLLIAADSVISGLVEVSPTSLNPLPRFSYHWVYRSISACAFRAIADVARLYNGPVTAITQQVVFNISRALPD